MPAARYYPTCATLANGDGFIASGAAVRGLGGNVPNDDYEIFARAANRCGPKLRFRPKNTNFLAHAEYPFLQLLFNGSDSGLLFVMSWNKARLFDLEGGRFRAEEFITPRAGGRTYPRQGAAVLLPQWIDSPWNSRILVVGGEHDDELVTDAAEIFEYDGSNPAACRWRPAKGPVTRHRRFMSDAVLLPDETVLVVNGASRGKADDSHDPVYEAEVFDTRSETWSRGAKINRARMYHSSACLLPDGRVAIAGNTYTFNPGNPVEDRTVELYSPAYLFRGPRPEITWAPSCVPYGQDFYVMTPNARAVDRVCLLRAGTVTHTNNMDQRHLLLRFTAVADGQLLVTPPHHPTLAPPGPWMLFLLDKDRVPSKARFVQVRAAVRDAEYASLEVPDHVKAGERFVATLRMRNTGSLMWGVGYKLGSQSPPDNRTWGTHRVELGTLISCGETAYFKFAATAPAEPGSYPFQWRMLEEGVEWFGASTPPVRIIVTGEGENPECDGIRAEVAQINEQVSNLSDQLNGEAKHDAPIIRRIETLQRRAGVLIKRGQALGCVIGIGPHH
jgi:hypothetical protein